MKNKIIKFAYIVCISLLPLITFGEVINIENIDVKVKKQKDDTFQIFVKFDLPDFQEKVNIDYAVLNLGLDILESDSSSMVFEILTEENKSRKKIKDYNNNPVTTIIPRQTGGLTTIEFDLTQLVSLWVKDGEENEGIILVLHRSLKKKFLKSGHIALVQEEIKPRLKIFYTAVE